MTNIVFGALFLSAFANQSFASTVNKLEVFPPFLKIGCSNVKTDAGGKLGLQLKRISTSETEDSLTISLEQQLKVCQVSKDDNGNNQLTWLNANPFTGYEVQYYDFKINKLNTRKEIIDTNSKFNRFESGIYYSSKSVIAKANLTGTLSGSAQASIVLDKNDLLDQNDFDLLNAGSEVKKVVILFNNLNVTTTIDEEVIQLGDQNFSSRNISITFIKAKNTFAVKSISL